MYPPPPWTLKGHSLQSLHFLDLDRVRATIPANLQIVSLWPGKTIGGVYAAAYGPESTLLYSELIVVSGLVMTQGKLGVWISQIYVDHPDSVAGGREIWGLPKQLARFSWNQDRTAVEISQETGPLCSLTSSRRWPGLPLAGTLPVLSQPAAQPLLFTGSARLTLQLARLQLEVPSASPLAGLDLGEPLLGFAAEPLTLVANPPQPI